MITKQEMLNDFTSAARDTYATSYGRLLEGELLHPGFVGKPLTALRLIISQESMGVDEVGEIADINESLNIGVVSAETLRANFNFHPEMEKYPDDIKKMRMSAVKKLSEIVLDQSLNVESILSAEQVYADYAATFREGHTVHMGTFQDSTPEQNIQMGNHFGNRARVYSQSSLLTMPLAYRNLIAAIGIKNSSEVEQAGLSVKDIESLNMKHLFTFDMNLDLPLNGYEPLGFLHAYKTSMEKRVERATMSLHKLQSTNGPKPLIDEKIKLIDKVTSAIRRVDQALEKNKSY